VALLRLYWRSDRDNVRKRIIMFSGRWKKLSRKRGIFTECKVIPREGRQTQITEAKLVEEEPLEQVDKERT
jgi:hypothetical protein